MIQDFPCHQQPTFSNSCLPTCVLSVLDYLAIHATEEQVSAWCGETDDGCDWEEARQGLAEEFDVENMATDWERVRDVVEHEEHPVIVTIGNPLSLATRHLLPDHAVVLVGFERENVVYMDPATGVLERMPQDRFRFGWNIPGEKAFTIR